MKITFHGAARAVTGFQHLIEVNDRRISAGLRFVSRQAQRSLRPQSPLALRGLAHRCRRPLTCAHDHSGNSAYLVKAGFRGDIYTTFATQDLCGATLLSDSAYIQERDVQ